MADDDCTSNGSDPNQTWMKHWDLNSDDAICIGRDRGVSSLLVDGAGSGDQELVHIAEPKKVVDQRRNISRDPQGYSCKTEGALEGGKCKATTWIVGGGQLVCVQSDRCATCLVGMSEKDMTGQGWIALTTEPC